MGAALPEISAKAGPRFGLPPESAFELKAAVGRQRGLILATVLFSACVNLLMMTGPLFMLQVYDRVLASGSEATLVALFLLAGLMFAAMAVLDIARVQVMTRAGARFQTDLDARVFDAALRRAAARPEDPVAVLAERDIDLLRQFAASPVLLACIDLPWVPVFLGAIFLFHPALGLLALAGAAILLATAVANQILTARRRAEAARQSGCAERLAGQLYREAGFLAALGLRGALQDRWHDARRRMLALSVAATDLGAVFGSATRVFRQFLQSAMLALGAWLVLRHQISPGVMIASSILLGRGLQPIEVLVGQWSMLQAARLSWSRLRVLLAGGAPRAAPLPLDRPEASLRVRGLTIAAPARPDGGEGERRPILQRIDFALAPGQVLGVIGPSAAGKSALARAVTGLWTPQAGDVRLGGATFAQHGEAALGRWIGYLPQSPSFFDGTVAENIARMAPDAPPQEVLLAARRAGAHQMILSLPDGYDTQIRAEGPGLSGGQLQRIGLARALYGDPVLLVLDEPDAHLDAEGGAALNRALREIKARGASAMVMAHRPSALQECDLVLRLDQGRQLAFGPRDEVLRAALQTGTQALRPVGTAVAAGHGGGAA